MCISCVGCHVESTWHHWCCCNQEGLGELLTNTGWQYYTSANTQRNTGWPQYATACSNTGRGDAHKYGLTIIYSSKFKYKQKYRWGNFSEIQVNENMLQKIQKKVKIQEGLLLTNTGWRQSEPTANSSLHTRLICQLQSTQGLYINLFRGALPQRHSFF